jgi:nucleoside recognition membrane protein YjiH
MLCTISISVVRLNLEFEVNDYVMHSYVVFALLFSHGISICVDYFHVQNLNIWYFVVRVDREGFSTLFLETSKTI